MKAIARNLQAIHLLVGDLDADRIKPGIKLCFDDKASLRSDAADELHYGLVIDERPATPVLGDVTEEPVLDLVPLAGAWRKMGNADVQACSVREGLKLGLPETRSVAVAASRVSGDQQLRGIGVGLLPHVAPPVGDRPHSKRWGVVVDPDVHPGLVPSQIVHAVRDHLAAIIDEVVHAYRHGTAARLPLGTDILEFSDELLLLRVDGDDWLAAGVKVIHPAVDVLELRVSVGMLRALDGLVRPLQAVASCVAQLTNFLRADLHATRSQLARQLPRALGCPSQRRLRID